MLSRGKLFVKMCLESQKKSNEDKEDYEIGKDNELRFYTSEKLDKMNSSSAVTVDKSLVPSTSKKYIEECSGDDFSDSGSEYIPEEIASNLNFDDDESASDLKNKNICRWKRSRPDQSKRNMNKKKKIDGQKYLNSKGKFMDSKMPKIINCAKCKYKCSTKINENMRKKICREYWNMDFKRQKDFLLKVVSKEIPKRRKTGAISKNKNFSRCYFFFENEIKHRVCKDFFLKTLCISHGPVDSALSGCSEFGNFVGNDKRGKTEPKNKTPKEILQNVKKHIESFSTMESHYCRKSSKRLYLDPTLSISKMYELYQKFCKNESTAAVSEITYRRYFCQNFNLSFFKPKKDLCVTCDRYKRTKENEEEYQLHIERKIEAFEAKTCDKLRSNNDDNFISATFDLQSVLQIPSSDVSLMYYSRKLCAYNLTIYESKDPNNAHCYVWDETNGQRGSCEIGTALFKWISSLPENIKEISLFSDTCSGQNRNQYIASLFLFIVQSKNEIQAIQHNFLESGHSYMEADSIHSAIENAKKYVPIYIMHDWINVIRLARSKRSNKKCKPYEVTELSYNDIKNLKALAHKIIINRTVNTNGEKVEWLKIKCMRYEKEKPDLILYKYNYSEEFKILKVSREKPTRNNKMPCNLDNLYKNRLPISSQKKRDLIKLCEKKIIPEIFHSWYKELYEENKSDFTSEPDVQETESEGEEEK